MGITSVSRHEVLSLYRQLFRVGSRIQDYNMKEYAKRRIKQSFQQNRVLENTDDILKSYMRGKKNLQMLTRQSIMTQLYPSNTSVMQLVSREENINR